MFFFFGSSSSLVVLLLWLFFFSGCSPSEVEKRMLSLWAVSWNNTYVLMKFMQRMNYIYQPVALYPEQTINVLIWRMPVEERSGFPLCNKYLNHQDFASNMSQKSQNFHLVIFYLRPSGDQKKQKTSTNMLSLDFRPEIWVSGAQCPIFGRALLTKVLSFERKLDKACFESQIRLQFRRSSKSIPLAF